MSAEKKVGVIPGGALGSAFAKLAAERGYLVTIRFHRSQSLEFFNETYRSDRLGGVNLPPCIQRSQGCFGSDAR